LRDVLHEHFDPKKLPPITKWRTERDKQTVDLQQFSGEYKTLRDETAAVDKIKRNVADNLDDGTWTLKRTKTRGMELYC
jgi:hypothetical protein